MKKVHQQTILMFVYNRHHFHSWCSVVAADDLIERSSAMQIVDHEVNNFIQMLGDYTNTSFDINTEYKVVYDHAAEICTQQAQYDSSTVLA